MSKLKNRRYSSLEYSSRFETSKGSTKPVSRSSYVYRKVKSLMLAVASINTGSKVRILSTILCKAASPLRILEAPVLASMSSASVHQDTHLDILAESCKIGSEQDANVNSVNEFPS